MRHSDKASRQTTEGLSLLSIIDGSMSVHQNAPPIFGAQASWLCFGSGLAGRLYEASERGDHSLRWFVPLWA